MAALLIRSFIIPLYGRAESVLTQVITANRLAVLLNRGGTCRSQCHCRFARQVCQTFAICPQRQS